MLKYLVTCQKMLKLQNKLNKNIRNNNKGKEKEKVKGKDDFDVF